MRVLLMEMNQESNSFCSVDSVVEDFARCCLCEGEALMQHVRGKQVALGGMIAAMEENDVEIIPGFAMRANAGGKMTAEAVAYFCDKFKHYAAVAGKVDGVFISFHGATQSTVSDDVCGDVLTLARSLAGEAVIACSFDLHANITRQIVENADIICGYQSYPHVDHFNTGYRAATLGIAKMRGEQTAMAWGFLPMIEPASGYTTREGAVKEFTDGLFAEVQAGKISDFTAFQMQPWLDVTEGNSAIVVIAADAETAKQTVAEYLPKMWNMRHKMRGDIADIDAAIRAAEAHAPDKPVIISDFADSPNAGAAGDNFDIAAAMMQRAPHLKIATVVNDPDFAAAAFAAGVGGTVTAPLGGAKDKACSTPYTVTARVLSLHDGSFRMEGPAMHGVEENVGKTATVRIGNCDVVVTGNMTMTGEPQLLRHFGVEPIFYDAVIVKACTSFKVPYAPIAGEILAVDTGCPATADLTKLPFVKLPKSFYPFTDTERPEGIDTVYCK